MFESTLITN